MAGECTLVALSNRANTIFTMAGNLGENSVKTKRFLLRGGTHNETIGHVEAGKPITVTYHNGDTFESAHDLTRKFANKFTKLSDDDSVTLCGNAPICIHEHATQALYDALKEMIETIKDPPGGFAEVARELKKVTQVVREILQRVQVEWTFSDYAAFSAKLMLVSQCGARSVGEIDPFAFVDQALTDAIIEAGNAAQQDDEAEAIPAESDGQYVELRTFSADNLKGKQRRVIELVIEAGGRLKLADVAIDPVVDWPKPFDDTWNSLRKEVNSKLKRAAQPWRLRRQDNQAVLSRAGQK